MSPQEFFEVRFRAAEVLLRVYRLLDSDSASIPNHELLSRLRTALGTPDHEQLILVMNHVFTGIVREQADLSPRFFRRENLCLLLRQSVVTACSALDVFLPVLLEHYLPAIVRIQQRTFSPKDGETKAVLARFRLDLDDAWTLVEEGDRQERLDLLTQRLLDYCRNETLANEHGIAATLSLLTIDRPWEQIATAAGEPESSLRRRVRDAIARRNRIIHHADRPQDNLQGPAAPIEYTWTHNHVTAIQTVALACCSLAGKRLDSLQHAEPVGAPQGVPLADGANG